MPHSINEKHERFIVAIAPMCRSCSHAKCYTHLHDVPIIWNGGKRGVLLQVGIQQSCMNLFICHDIRCAQSVQMIRHNKAPRCPIEQTCHPHDSLNSARREFMSALEKRLCVESQANVEQHPGKAHLALKEICSGLCIAFILQAPKPLEHVHGQWCVGRDHPKPRIALPQRLWHARTIAQSCNSSCRVLLWQPLQQRQPFKYGSTHTYALLCHRLFNKAQN